MTERALPQHDWKLRAAASAGGRRIAGPYRISSDGVADEIRTRLAAPGEDLPDAGRRRYERERTPFGDRKLVAVHGAAA